MLKGKYIILREIEESDLPQLQKWRNADFIRKNVREFKPLTIMDQKKWFESLSSSNHIMFAIEITGILIGCCGLTYIDWKNGCTEISIYFGMDDWQDNEYTNEAIQLLLKYGFKELRLHRIFGNIFSYNKKTIELFEHHKFILDGRIRESRYWNGQYYDELVYSILSNEYKE